MINDLCPPVRRALFVVYCWSERTLTFFHLWTRLEAALKADGRGLTAPRPEFEEILERYDIETEQRNDLIWSIATEK
ncbi:MAG: 4-phosphopantetheinyl transferase family protein [Clostridia bacterium]|nr:4-phosphopantetheinyl transferase family protein [Clostridia bacterium]